MRYLLLFLFLSSSALAQPVNAPGFAPVQCNKSAVYDTNANGLTELVALSAGKQIYVCGYTINSGGTVNVALKYGTGTACATGTTSLTPAYSMVAQEVITDSSPFFRGLNVPAGNALCLSTSAGVAVQAVVMYGQY